MTINEIGKLIITQDNRSTDQPIFVVEKSSFIVADPHYGYDSVEWVRFGNGDPVVADDKTARRLEALEKGKRKTRKWEKFYLRESWEFVTCCFTEHGCLNYIKANGHNLGKVRIYTYGSFRNREWQEVRNHLLTYDKIESERDALLTLAEDAIVAWGADRDAEVGRLLHAMLDKTFRASYRPDLAGDKK